jgi:putative phosphoribosyl transferase
MEFANRHEAGRRLAEKLRALRLADPVVLALPRGGVPVGLEVARALGAPLDLVLVRKIGAPGHPELAAAAVVDTDPPQLVANAPVLRSYGITEAELAGERDRQLAEMERRRGLYLAGRKRVPLAGRTAILVDDGIATGTTARAALLAVRRAAPRELVLAVPVAAPDTLAELAGDVDRAVCLLVDPDLTAVGACYQDFRQVDDAEVSSMLAEASATS